jgi:hypothetical protein
MFLIFSIYLFVLPGLACAETDICADDLQSSVSQTANHDKHEEEDCGNFCTCSCCVHIISVNFQSLKIIIDKQLATNNLLSIYNNISLPSNYFGNIWQPPKIG